MPHNLAPRAWVRATKTILGIECKGGSLMKRTFAACLMAMLSIAVNAEPAMKWVTGWAA